MPSRQVSLSVNDVPIMLAGFVRGYIDHVVGGILSSLKGTGEIQDVDLTVQGDRVSILLNHAEVSLTSFAARIIHDTLIGMISSLKGVSTVERMKISIKQ
jgi:D-serine deaminase-like pyridoxal phosphate-dependent protein